MIIALPVPMVLVLFCFIINQHNWKVLFIVTSVWFLIICSCWWLRRLIKKLIVLLNKLFETTKKPLAVVNFKRSSEDFLKPPPRCKWRRSMLFILNCCIDTAELYRNLVDTLLESDISLIEFVFSPRCPLGVSVKPWGCSKTISFSQILLQSNSWFKA